MAGLRRRRTRRCNSSGDPTAGDAHEHGGPVAYVHRDTTTHQYADSGSDARNDADAHSHVDTLSHSYYRTYGYGHSNTHCCANGNRNTRADRHPQPDPHPQTYRHPYALAADSHAHSDAAPHGRPGHRAAKRHFAPVR